MKIRMADGHQIFSGESSVQIVTKMRNLYNRFKEKNLETNEEYMQGCVERMRHLYGTNYSGETEEERCASFIQSLIRTDQAEEVRQ